MIRTATSVLVSSRTITTTTNKQLTRTAAICSSSEVVTKRRPYSTTTSITSITSTIVDTMGTIFGKESVAEPPFTVLLQRSTTAGVPYEIRQYGTRMAAETSMKDQNGENNAFRTLASYIGVFGKAANEGQESIAMTAPVVMGTHGGKSIAMTAPVVRSEGEIMQFMLPVEYDSMDKVPKPTNPAVHIKELPPSVGAVHRYAGSFSPERSRKVATELYQQIHTDGVKDMSVEDAMTRYQFWGYNPPFTLPMFRRNEVWIPLTQQQADALVQTAAEQKLN